jgi:predicted HicB family RNase H-like nuclease
MEYKGYIGEFTLDEKLDLFQGKISNIQDVITFQGKSMETLRYSFNDAINEYVTWCQKNGKNPEKPSLKNKKVRQTQLN